MENTRQQSPATIEELAEVLRNMAGERRSVRIEGACTKQAWGGAIRTNAEAVTTRALRRVIQYESSDLTVSVEAGIPFAELQRVLAEQGQTIPLDPPYRDRCTVGGTLAANASGPRRRLYGTARDMVIGMTIVTPHGDIVKSGGMVVKNVAGLDLQKLMIGSYGTLGVIATVNFKVAPLPEATKTFVLSFASAKEVTSARDRVLQGVLQPAALDVLNPAAAARCGLHGFCLIVCAGGSERVLRRYAQELTGGESYESAREETLLTSLREMTPAFLDNNPDGAVVKVSHTLSSLGSILDSSNEPVVARAGNGVSMIHYTDTMKAITQARSLTEHGHPAIVEACRHAGKGDLELWPAPGDALDTMTGLKCMLDPERLMNAGRLHGRI